MQDEAPECMDGKNDITADETGEAVDRARRNIAIFCDLENPVSVAGKPVQQAQPIQVQGAGRKACLVGGKTGKP